MYAGYMYVFLAVEVSAWFDRTFIATLASCVSIQVVEDGVTCCVGYGGSTFSSARESF